METYLAQANDWFLYLLAVGVVVFVLTLSAVFLVRAYRRGVAIGMDRAKLKKAISSSAAFTVVPSIGILLGVIALSGSLGIPVPWIRLSVIGALHYESMAAETAVKAMGLSLSAEQMTVQALITATSVMTIGIMWGSLFCVFGLKRYQRTIRTVSEKDGRWGPILFSSMFIGLVSAFVASYAAKVAVGSFTGLVVILVSAGAMAGFEYLIERRGQKWLESFSLSFAMLLGMAAAIVV